MDVNRVCGRSDDFRLLWMMKAREHVNNILIKAYKPHQRLKETRNIYGNKLHTVCL